MLSQLALKHLTSSFCFCSPPLKQAATSRTSEAAGQNGLLSSLLSHPFSTETHLDCDEHGVYTLTFVGEGEHRINPNLVTEVNSQLDKVLQDKRPVALVTANEGRFWSNGLDIDWVKANPQERLEPAVQAMLQIVRRFLELPIPTLASLKGHAAGGGLALTFAHDYRYMRPDSKSVLYLSGIDIGLPHPPGINALLRSKMRPDVFRDAVLKGKKYKGPTALLADLIERDPPGNPWDDANWQAQEMARILVRRRFDREVYGTMKRDMYREALHVLEHGGIGQLATMGLFGKTMNASRSPKVS